MNFQFTHPGWLLLLLVALPWAFWWVWHSDVQISRARRWVAFALRLIILLALILAVAGLQWLRPQEGMNVYFLLDRSDSIPPGQQEQALEYINRVAEDKQAEDKAGIIVFGTEASIESTANPVLDHLKIQAVVDTERTDIAGAIRLGTAAFPETGQKRLVLLSDGNENLGDAVGALLASKPLGVSTDVVPLGVDQGRDVSIQKLDVPSDLKKGQTFEVKIFAESDREQPGTVRLFLNDRFLGEQPVQLSSGKNLFTFSQTLEQPDFYEYEVQLETPRDRVPQNNRARSFTQVKGDPRVLIVSSDPEADQALARALESAKLRVNLTGISGFPESLAEMQSYETIFLSNVAAGDLGEDLMNRLKSAVRDFGVGLVCVGGDQAYGAGGYRGTPLEETLPLDMELDSKKVLPNGALVMIMHGMEFNNGNQVARETALGVLDALGPRDELGVVLWDGRERWLFPLSKVGDKREMGKQIAGMNQGDLPSFQNVMQMAYQALQKSNANLKHIIVFSDGDPAPPSQALMQQIVQDKITVSSVLIAGHAGPDTMIQIAEQGGGRFYNVQSPTMLPQIFIKEAAVILKSAIFEEPFQPRLVSQTEPVAGIGPDEYPQLRGYVATSPKPRAEIPLLSHQGDPVLAHWQFGLGRAAAFTSDAKSKWAAQWLNWGKYEQFWSQLANWSLQRVENADFTSEVTVEKGKGHLSVEAVDTEGQYRNFLNLQTVVTSPSGESERVYLEQTGPGRYEAEFPTREVGAYLLNLMDIENGQLRARQVLGASVNYSPEFNASRPNQSLLRRLGELGDGKVLEMRETGLNPFRHDRLKTFQPNNLWDWLLKLAVILFPLDVAVRRVQLDKAEWLRATENLRRWLFFWRTVPASRQAEPSLAALLSRRDQVRSSQPARSSEARPDLFQPRQSVSPPTQVQTGDARKDQTKQTPAQPSAAEESAPPKEESEEGAQTTGRLLDAKRRAQKWRK